MKKLSHYLKIALHWLKRAFTKNMGMKIGALVFALILWSFVQVEENPLRQKVFNNIPITYNAAEQVRQRGLTSPVPVTDILKFTTLTVETNANRLSNITEDTVTAFVDLSVIAEPGEYTLPVRGASASGGTVVGLNPSEVTIDVEPIVSQQVPVEVVVDERGKEDWLYYGTPVLQESTVEVTGARSNVEQAAKAVCEIDISGMENPLVESRSVVLLDNSGEELSQDMFTSVSSVIVEMPIYPKKSVPVDTDSALETVSGVADGYEVVSMSFDPANVYIAGTNEDIEGIESVRLVPIALEDGDAEMQIANTDVVLPDGVYAVTPGQVAVTVNIEPKQEDRLYSAVDVDIKNIGEGYEAVLDPQAIDINVRGTLDALDNFTADMLKPFVDLGGLGPGKYTVEVKFENEPDLGVSVTPATGAISVTIREIT